MTRPLPRRAARAPIAPTPPQSVARAAREQAARVRGRALVDLHSGALTLPELLAAASEPSGVALQRLRLATVLHASGIPPRRTATAIRHMLALLEEPVGDRTGRITVSWLLDDRSAGRRLLALQDGLAPRSRPWPGYPWRGRPGGMPATGLDVSADGVMLR